jgi:hypothetical protein
VTVLGRHRRDAEPPGDADLQPDDGGVAAADAEVASEDRGSSEDRPRPRWWIRRRRRRPGPPAAFGWRWVYPVALAGLVAATLWLSIDGSRLVLHSKDGRLVPVERDPSKPGYFAQVTPTRTLLVVQTNATGDLVGVDVMSLSLGDRGGWMMFFPPDLIVPTGPDKSNTLRAVHAENGPDGPGGLRTVLGALLSAGIDEVIPLDATAIAGLIEPVAPLRYSLADSVRTVQNGRTTTLLNRGAVEIQTLDQVRAATEVVSPGEANLARFQRQQDFWKAWVDAVRRAPDKTKAFPAATGNSAIPRFLTAFATGEVRVEPVPFNQVSYQGASLLVPDRAALAPLVVQMIPFPLPDEAGNRVRVDVRNGTGDFSTNEAMTRKLVAAGAQIVVLGNAATFAVERTSVVYYEDSLKDKAEQLARAVRATDVRFEDRPESSIDATVTIGSDFVP